MPEKKISIKILWAAAIILSKLFFYSCTPPPQSDILLPGPQVRILLAELSQKDSLVFKSAYNLKSEEARYEFGERNKNLNIVPLTKGLRLYNQNRNLLYHEHFPVILEPQNSAGSFLFRNRAFTGSIIFQQATDSSLYMINKLPMEEYLKGVVPAEIYATKKEYFEAVKAQAICARTYALNRLQQNKNKPFDMHSTIADQVYGGQQSHKPLADLAIEETKGIILTYHDSTATIYYHSTCGGKLESAENVWPSQQISYMAGGLDAVSEVFSCSPSPHFRWVEKRNIAQLDSAFLRFFNKSYINKSPSDTLKLNFKLQIVGRNSSGRVNEIQITYADTSVSLRGYEIRRFFALPPVQYLRSTLFFVTQPNDSTLEIHGAGNGHGVGMCQFGAMTMSERGFRYYHILDKYFKGTILTRKY